MDKTVIYYVRLTLVLLLLLMVSLAGNVWQYKLLQEQSASFPDTVRITKYRYIKDNNPTPAEEHLTGKTIAIKVRTAAVPSTTVPAGSPSGPSDTVPTIVGDSLFLPVTQRIYRDSSYVAWVSGFAPQLDSITVRERLVTLTVTKWKQKHWHFGIGGATGVSVITGKPDVTIGFFAGYSF